MSNEDGRRRSSPENFESATERRSEPGLTPIENLVYNFLGVIDSHYRKGPLGPDRVYEILNALAYLVAITAKGSNNREVEVLGFFSDALNLNLDNPEWEETMRRLKERGVGEAIEIDPAWGDR